MYTIHFISIFAVIIIHSRVVNFTKYRSNQFGVREMTNTFKRRKQLFLLFFLFILVCGVCIILNFMRISTNSSEDDYKKLEAKPKQNDPLYCYDIQDDILEDISEVNVRKGKTIFFHETSCMSKEKGKIVLSAREACAVESAARYNPDFDVFLLFTSPGLIKNNGEESDKIIDALLKYKNIKFYHLNYGKYTANTPIEHLYKSGKIKSSKYAISHASDVLRYLTLWKYGGIYLDLDVIVKKSLQNLPQNFAGYQEPNYVAAGVLSFTPDGLGHILARSCVDHLADNFNGNVWGANGPDVITRLLKNICKKKNGDIDTDCPYYKVYDPEVFYPISYPRWTFYFKEEYTNKALKLTEDSYILHIWNKMSSKTKVKKNGTSAYKIFAEMHCPSVFSACFDYI